MSHRYDWSKAYPVLGPPPRSRYQFPVDLPPLRMTPTGLRRCGVMLPPPRRRDGSAGLLRGVLVFLFMLAVAALLSVDDIETGQRAPVSEGR